MVGHRRPGCRLGARVARGPHAARVAGRRAHRRVAGAAALAGARRRAQPDRLRPGPDARLGGCGRPWGGRPRPPVAGTRLLRGRSRRAHRLRALGPRLPLAGAGRGRPHAPGPRGRRVRRLARTVPARADERRRPRLAHPGREPRPGGRQALAPGRAQSEPRLDAGGHRYRAGAVASAPGPARRRGPSPCRGRPDLGAHPALRRPALARELRRLPAHAPRPALRTRGVSAAAPVSAGRGEVVAPRPLGRLVRWSIPTLGNYCLLVVIVLLVAQASRFLLDSDTGWQIRAGDWILAHGRVPRVDVFSYTMAGRPWFAWEWLSDVLMSLLHRAGGLAGLVGAAIVLLAVTYGALFRVMAWRGADPFTAFVLTLLAAFASMIHWLARPHLLSIPLMLLAGTLIEAYRRTGTRWVYALPPLVAVWANLHGGFVVVVAMLVIYAVGEWLER